MKVYPRKIYDKLGEAYAEKSESSVYNACYERPAMISLLPKLKDKIVLDAGCGAGPLTEYIVDRGGQVFALDISEKLIAIAKARQLKNADFRVYDLNKPLFFIPDNSVDIIVSSLTMHYIDDWNPVLLEFKRILKPSGTIIISTHHPTAVIEWVNLPDYFDEGIVEDTWNVDGQSHKINYYHKTLSSHFSFFESAGFYVEILLEPQPILAAKSISKSSYDKLMTKPHFILYKLKNK